MAEANNSSIVLCPYNYIIDPVVRRAMKIDVTDSIIVFDEGHNIPDLLRDAASVEISLETVDGAYHNLCALASGARNRRHMYAALRDMVAGIRCLVRHFIIEEGGANDDTFTRNANVFSGLETASSWSGSAGLNAHTIKLRRNDYNEVLDTDAEHGGQGGAAVVKGSGRLDTYRRKGHASPKKSDMASPIPFPPSSPRRKASAIDASTGPCISDNTKSVLNSFLTPAEYFFSGNLQNIKHFRLAVTRAKTRPISSSLRTPSSVPPPRNRDRMPNARSIKLSSNLKRGSRIRANKSGKMHVPSAEHSSTGLVALLSEWEYSFVSGACLRPSHSETWSVHPTPSLSRLVHFLLWTRSRQNWRPASLIGLRRLTSSMQAGNYLPAPLGSLGLDDLFWGHSVTRSSGPILTLSEQHY